jgi:hypothetical protein
MKTQIVFCLLAASAAARADDPPPPIKSCTVARTAQANVHVNRSHWVQAPNGTWSEVSEPLCKVMASAVIVEEGAMDKGIGCSYSHVAKCEIEIKGQTSFIEVKALIYNKHKSDPLSNYKYFLGSYSIETGRNVFSSADVHTSDLTLRNINLGLLGVADPQVSDFVYVDVEFQDPGAK